MSESQISSVGWKQFLAEHGDGGAHGQGDEGAALRRLAGGRARNSWAASPVRLVHRTGTGSAISVRIANLDAENRRMSFTPA